MPWAGRGRRLTRMEWTLMGLEAGVKSRQTIDQHTNDAGVPRRKTEILSIVSTESALKPTF